jgi:hypothetical protein
MNKEGIYKLQNVDDVVKFIFGGNSIITIESVKTGRWFTYRIKRASKKDKNSPYFVSVLTGGDNDNSYTYMGAIFNFTKFIFTKNSRVSKEALSYKAFKVFFDLMNKNIIHKDMNVYHSGVCSVCGRKLTTADSLKDGMGPICSGRYYKMGIQDVRKKKLQFLNRLKS